MAKALNTTKRKKDIIEQQDMHDMIARIAYQRFIARGCVHGYDQEDWFEAEKEAKKQFSSKDKKALRRTKKIPVE